MTSAFCCATLGIVPTVRHADYIGAWLEVLREDNRAVIRAASAASKAADFLLAFRTGAGDAQICRCRVRPERKLIGASAADRTFKLLGPKSFA